MHGSNNSSARYPNANEWSYYLAGEAKGEDGTRMTVSADNTVFSYTPKGERHGGGGGKVIREMMWMRYHDGPSKRVIK